MQARNFSCTTLMRLQQHISLTMPNVSLQIWVRHQLKNQTDKIQSSVYSPPIPKGNCLEGGVSV